MMGTLEVIVMEASKVKIVLPNVSALKEALQKAKTWSTKVEKVQVCNDASSLCRGKTCIMCYSFFVFFFGKRCFYCLYLTKVNFEMLLLDIK